MFEKQKWCLKSHILISIGLILSVFGSSLFMFYTFILNQKVVDVFHFISIVSILAGIVLAYLAKSYNIMYSFGYSSGRMIRLVSLGKRIGFNEGVPNNQVGEFHLTYLDLLKEEKIDIEETEEEIFETIINEKVIRFDMRKWRRKRFYIYEYFLTVIQLYFGSSNNNEACFCIKNASKMKRLELNIKSRDKKSKKYILISNNRTNPNACFKRRIKLKLSFLESKVFTITDFYNFY